MTSLPSDVPDGLVASGRESGRAVAVVRDRVLHLEHAAGTRDGTEAWALDTLVVTFSAAKMFAAWAFLDAVAEGHLEVPVWDQATNPIHPRRERREPSADSRQTISRTPATQACVTTFPGKLR